MGQLYIVKSNSVWLHQGETYQITASSGKGSGGFASYCTFSLPEFSHPQGLKIFKHIECQDAAGFEMDGRRVQEEFAILSDLETAHGHAPKAYALAQYINGDFTQWALVEEHMTGSIFQEIKPVVMGSFSSPAAAALEVGRSICQALVDCSGLKSGQTYLHRDTSFSNMRFDFDTEAKRLNCVLLDFGQSTRVNGTPTQTIMAHAANVPYGAPEMFNLKSPDKKGPALDTWGVAALMYEVALGRYPFAGELNKVIAGGQLSVEDCLRIQEIKSQKVDLSALIGSAYGASCAQVIAQGLLANPAERPIPAELLKEIEVALRPPSSANLGDAYDATPEIMLEDSEQRPHSEPEHWDVDMVLFEDGELVVNPAPADYEGREVIHRENTAHSFTGFVFRTSASWAEGVRKIRFAGRCCPGPRDMEGFFWKTTNLESIDFGQLDTSRVTSLNSAFACCGIEKLDLSELDLSHVTSMEECFAYSDKLKEIIFPESGFPALKNISSAFKFCGKLDKLDLSGFNTAQVEDMELLFFGCRNIRMINLINWDTSQVQNMDHMFKDCGSLRTIYVSEGFDASNCLDQAMFTGCISLSGNLNTTYNSDRVTGRFAHVDHGVHDPGYFTPQKVYEFQEAQR